MRITTTNTILAAILAVVSAPLASAEDSYFWEEPQATVTETGAIRWKPEPFKDNLEGQDVRYIDFEAGDDSNDGKSPDSPWKHHPWDHFAEGQAAEAEGPMTYVFKRGVFYRNPLRSTGSGEPGKPIRLTSTADWGEGEAVLVGSIRIDGEWVRADRSDFDLPKHLPEVDKVWAVDLSEWWNRGRPGRNAMAVHEDAFKFNRGIVKPPRIGLFKVGADGSSDMQPLAQDPNWQRGGDQFALDYWHEWSNTAEPFKDKEGNKIKSPGNNGVHGPAQADELKGKPQDFFDGAYFITTWNSLMGGPTPRGPIEDKINKGKKNEADVHMYDPERGAFAIGSFHGFRKGQRYKVVNAPGYLDDAGEFYIDDKGQEGAVLYYRPEEGADPNDLQLELAANGGAILIDGHSNIEIGGLGFRFIKGSAIRTTGSPENINIHHNRFEDLIDYAIEVDVRWDEEKHMEKWKGKREWALDRPDNIIIADNKFQDIWDQTIRLNSGASGSESWPFGRIKHTEVLRNHLENVGIEHGGNIYSAIPAIWVHKPETAIVAGNIIKRSYGSGILIHGGQTRGFKDSDWPLTRMLVFNNATENTALAVNDYGGFSLWEGGSIYAFNNNIGTSVGYMPGGLWGSPNPRTLSYPYYIDGGYKILGFNNIIWDRSVDPEDPYRSQTAGYFSVFGFLNHFTNNTVFRHARGTGGSSGNRTDLVSNVFAEISSEFVRNNRVENPSLVGGGDTGASGIQGIPSLAYGLNVFHGPAESGVLVESSERLGITVPVDIVGPSIAEMSEQMQEFPTRWGQLGTQVDDAPVVGEAGPDGLTAEGAEGGDFRLSENSAAIDAGATYFVPWPLAANVGEWQFTENHADPTVVTDYSFYMSEAHFQRFMYNQVPTLPLSLSDATLETYVPAPSEDWVNGAVAFDGQRFAKVADREMRADFELGLAAYISNTGQRTYKIFDKAINREIWEVPEPDIKKNGQPAFSEGKKAVYPGERRNTLISTTRNLLLEVKFKTEPGHTGGYLANKQDGQSGYALAIDEQGRAVFTVMAGGERDSVTTAEPVNDGKWRHVLAEIHRESGRMTIYLDGETSGEGKSGLSAGTSIDNEADFVVARSSAAEDGYFTGAIDFLRVCHATLEDSKTSIGELYAWQYVSGPHLFDMRGQEPVGERRDAGALERISFDGLLTESLDREYWTGISGTEVGDLTGHADYPDSPTASDTLTRFEAVDWNDPDKTQEWADSYGQRIRGYIVPEVTGAYTFWIASDEQSELWLSTDSDPANASKIAHVDGYATQYQYNKSGTQKSSSIRLAAGAVYYVEVLHKEGGGGDHVSVAWSTDSGITPTSADIIPGSVLSAFSAGVPGGGGGSTVIAEDASDSVHEGTRKNVAVLDGDRLCSLIRAYENGDDL
ncbi:MAG: LamG-like jellyroll fold domain-containing protein [Verrucomicrobiota bacterium]